MSKDQKSALLAGLAGAAGRMGSRLWRGAAKAESEPPRTTPAEMCRLSFLVGKWSGRRTSPFALKFTRYTTWEAGGKYLITRERVGSHEVLSSDDFWVVGHDAATRVYRRWEFSWNRDAPREWVGHFDGKALVFSYTEPAGKEERESSGRIGIQWEPSQEGYFRIAQVVPASPASGAGLKPGDQILKIDGRLIVDPQQFVEQIWGPVGTTVRLTVRSGDNESEITVTRQAPVRFPIMRERFEPDRRGYVQTEEYHDKDHYEKSGEMIFSRAR